MSEKKTELAQQGLILALAAMLNVNTKEIIKDTNLIKWVFKTANEMAKLEINA